MADPLPTVSAARRLEIAYLNVFGPPDKRSGDQALVWQDMEQFCYAYRLVTERTTAAAIDPKSSEFNDGRRSWWLRARGQIIKALRSPRPTPISRKKPNNP